jgi:3',5'-cyclic AMP phosphodiesterase CpdA
MIKKWAPDVVVCSGDITSISDPREFQQSVEALRPLYEDPNITFIYVPGNHDHYVNNPLCFQALEEAFYLLNQRRWRLSDLPLSHEMDEVDFILVNQAAPASWLMSTGMIAHETKLWWENKWHQVTPPTAGEFDKMKILIGHFPLFDREGRLLPRRRRCLKMECLQNAFRQGQINLSLCGHIHEPFIRAESPKHVEICAGSLTATGMMNQIELMKNHQSFKQQWLKLPGCSIHDHHLVNR